MIIFFKSQRNILNLSESNKYFSQFRRFMGIIKMATQLVLALSKEGTSCHAGLSKYILALRMERKVLTVSFILKGKFIGFSRIYGVATSQVN